MPRSSTTRAFASIFVAIVMITGVLPITVHAQTGSNNPTDNGSGTNAPSNNGSGANNPTNNGSGSTGTTIANPLKYDNLESVLDAILDAAIKLGTVILTLALIYTGFLFVAARGNVESIRKARSALLYTIIGGLILLGAKAIEVVIRDTVTSLTP